MIAGEEMEGAGLRGGGEGGLVIGEQKMKGW